MTYSTMHSITISIVAAALLSAGVTACAHGAPVVLTKPGTTTYIRQMQMGPDGHLCIVGQVVDPDGDLQPRGTVILFSTEKNQVLWQQTVDSPDDSSGNRFVACRSDGKATYVAANVETQSQRTLSQSLAYVYQFDAAGKVAGRKELVTGAANSFVYDIDMDGKGVGVVGMANDRKANGDTNAIFFASLDRGLRMATYTRLATGAYQSDAVVRLSGNVALLGGNFAPASVAKDDLPEDYAVSRIVAGKYQFSVRPQKARPDDVGTAITPAGEFVSLGAPAKATTLTVVGADGKLAETRPIQSKFCLTRSLSADTAAVYAIRLSCSKSQEPARLVQIDRKTGVESLVPGVTGEPQRVLAVDGGALVVVRKGNGSLVLQSVGKGT